MRYRADLLVGPFLAVALALPGCERSAPVSVWEAKRIYAERIVAGADVGTAWTIKAASFDARQGVLLDVTIDDGHGRYYAAERAQLIIDPATDTLTLRLAEVTKAIAEGEGPGSGYIETGDELVSEAIKLPFDVVTQAD